MPVVITVFYPETSTSENFEASLPDILDHTDVVSFITENLATQSEWVLENVAFETN